MSGGKFGNFIVYCDIKKTIEYSLNKPIEHKYIPNDFYVWTIFEA